MSLKNAFTFSCMQKKKKSLELHAASNATNLHTAQDY